MGLRGPLPRDVGRETPIPGVPKMPPGLAPRAQAIYRETGRALHRIGTISKLDGPTLAEYAICAWQCEQLGAELADGLIITVEGVKREHPAAKALREVQVRLERAAAALGLNPLARQRTPAPQAETKSELEELNARRASRRQRPG